MKDTDRLWAILEEIKEVYDNENDYPDIEDVYHGVKEIIQRVFE